MAARTAPKQTTPPTLEASADGRSIRILDQTKLPHDVRFTTLRTSDDAARAIVTMQVRGAPLIGVTAAFGLAFALRKDPSDAALSAAFRALLETRPTAVNLRWALEDVRNRVAPLPPAQRAAAALAQARDMIIEDTSANRRLGEHGLALLKKLAARKKSGDALNVMTHCNAGATATLGWGTATAPVYLAHESGLQVHVWVSETRPRNQGGALTAWELASRGVPMTVVTDNAAGHLMQRGLVDAVIVGADRVTARGDAANKIGTYLKALAAREHSVPFFVAFPGSTIDWTIRDGVAEIPIEQRSPDEVTCVAGATESGGRAKVRITPPGVAARNDAFDVTPASFITAFITERGVCRASGAGLRRLYPEMTAKS
jgi:methylthioribose-1-phosphate isomerase